MLKKLCIFSVLIFMGLSCKKDVLVPNEGIYRGIFNEIRSSGDTVASGVVYMALWESTLKFQITGDSLTNAPATHHGSYLVDDATRMQFQYGSAYSTQYDADHYLDTTYNYSFVNNTFEFWFQDDTTLYEYRLSRD
jgi:hypothetical protein